MAWIYFVLALVTVGCAGRLDAATRTTNLLGVALQAEDAGFSLELKRVLAQADAEHPSDDAAYKAQVADIMAVHEALEQARDAHRWLHLAVEQWRAGDDGAMWRETEACAAMALDALGYRLKDRAPAVQAQLHEIVDLLASVDDAARCNAPVVH